MASDSTNKRQLGAALRKIKHLFWYLNRCFEVWIQSPDACLDLFHTYCHVVIIIILKDVAIFLVKKKQLYASHPQSNYSATRFVQSCWFLILEMSSKHVPPVSCPTSCANVAKYSGDRNDSFTPLVVIFKPAHFRNRAFRSLFKTDLVVSRNSNREHI